MVSVKGNIHPLRGGFLSILILSPSERDYLKLMEIYLLQSGAYYFLLKVSPFTRGKKTTYFGWPKIKRIQAGSENANYTARMYSFSGCAYMPRTHFLHPVSRFY